MAAIDTSRSSNVQESPTHKGPLGFLTRSCCLLCVCVIHTMTEVHVFFLFQKGVRFYYCPGRCSTLDPQQPLLVKALLQWHSQTSRSGVLSQGTVLECQWVWGDCPPLLCFDRVSWSLSSAPYVARMTLNWCLHLLSSGFLHTSPQHAWLESLF